MSPLLGSAGGSSEYAFRGTLDDWPVDFASSLTAQDILGADPGSTRTATLTVTGINYKARLLVVYPNTTVSINGGSPVSANESDPKVFVRDNDVVTINFQIPLTGVSSFNTIHGIVVKIGKRTGTWLIRTRAIDATPDLFPFTNQTNLELNTLVTSNTITVSGLEPNFNFDLSVGSGVDYYKNGVLSTASTITSGDTLYLQTTTPNTFTTLRSYSVSIGGISASGITGGISTSWTITTRSGDNIPNTFTFTDILEANDLGGTYTSNPITISGIDAGPLDPNPFVDITAIPVTGAGPTSPFEIRKSDGTLRYTNPLDPTAPEYYQTFYWGIDGAAESVRPATTFAYLGDIIRLRVNNIASTYSTTRSDGLLLGYYPGDVGDTWNITTRPTPINTIPSGFSFTGLSLQNRGDNIFSNTITLSGMTTGAGDFGSASITSSTAGITPRFQVSRGGTIVKSYTAAEPFNVRNGDEITLRMTTPNPQGGDGAGTYTMSFQVSGTNTQTDDADRDGFSTISGSTSANWTVQTRARTCPINTFSFTDLTGVNSVNQNFDVVRTFTPSGFESDCAMVAIITSNSSSYNFTGVGSPIVAITPTKRLENITPGVPIQVTVRSSGTFSTPSSISRVTTNVQITNAETGNAATPDNSYTSPNWLIDTIGDATNASVVFNSPPTPTSAVVSTNITLDWTATNVVAFRSASWTASALPFSGSSTATMPASVGTGTTQFNISFFANPSAANYSTLPQDTADSTLRRYVAASVDVTVLNDLSAVFTPTNFTNVTTNCSIDGGSARVTSNSITISGITGTITGTIPAGEIVVGGGTQSSLNLGAFSSAAKTIGLGNSIRLEIPNNSTFLTGTTPSTETGTINFSDGNGTKTFTVTSSPCVSGTISQTSGTGANIITALTNARNANIFFASNTAPTIIASAYITEIPTATGTFTAWITATGATGQRFDGSAVDITWAQAFEAAFTLYNKQFWRISTDTVTTTPGFRKNPNFTQLTSNTGILVTLNSAIATLARDRVANPITNVTQWIDYCIDSGLIAQPADADRAIPFSMTSRTTGLSSTGLVFDFCQNVIPLVYPTA